MKPLRLGIIGCADIARRRFMPAVLGTKGIQAVAVAEEYDQRKLALFSEEYDLETVSGYEELINRQDIDAVYVPQPPAMHYQWAKLALQAGKHVLVEKPATVSAAQSEDLISIAAEKGLALHENYMFRYHSQIQAIRNMINEGQLGEIRLYRMSFGFPKRPDGDFRYIKALGGGALLDAGGYTIKLVSLLADGGVTVQSAALKGLEGYEVDMYGSATLTDSCGTVFQVGFGMDCAYQCSVEVWGSKGRLYTNRVFTAPEDYAPVLFLENAAGRKEITLQPDAHFRHSIEVFLREIEDDQERFSMYRDISVQAHLVDEIRRIAEEGGRN